MIRKVVTQLLLLGVLFNLTHCSPSPRTLREQEALPRLPFAQELQGALDRALQSGQRDHDLGLSAAVLVPGYETWTGVSGNSQPGVPITRDMLFDAGSVMKNFEAALALKLAEQGVLNLDGPLSMWLPAYRNVDSEITLRQLLNHTSGVFNVFENPDFPWVGPGVDYARSWRLEEVLDSFVLEPYGPPGFAQHYSSTNYLLLTAVLEQATGASVPAEVGRYFLDPLNLEHTFITMGEPLPARFPAAHPWIDVDRDGDLDDLAGIPITWIATLTHPVIFTTAEDLVRWMQALYYDRSVLNAGSLKEMLTYPETTLGDPDGGRFGLGVVDFTERLEVPVIGHAGSALGYSAAALYLPEYGTSMAWLLNTGEGPPDLAAAIMGHTWSSLSEVLRNHLKPQP
jgi:D-alanyl-D-alanine carboxypeptidase